MLCNSITEKCTIHANPAEKVCNGCFKSLTKKTTDIHNTEFFLNSAHYSNGKLFDNFLRRNPKSLFVRLDTKNFADDTQPKPSAPPPENYYQQFEDQGKTFQAHEEEEDDSKICSVCMDNPIEMAVIPCGHTCLCHGCSEDYKNNPRNLSSGCPLCRGKIERFLRIYLP